MNAVLKYGSAILGSVIVVVVIAAIAGSVFERNEEKAPAAAARATPAAPAAAPKATPAPTPAPAPAPTPAQAATAPATPGATAAAAAAGGGDLVTRIAAADPAAGMTIRVRCQTCHTFDNGGPNRVGPNLWNVVGRDKGAAPGYAYSDAMKTVPGTWTYADLDAFLTAPAKAVPGTKMAFAGIADAKDRANLIAHLRTLSTNPVPLN